MPRMVHRGKEKSGARGVSAPAMLGALIVGHGTPTARPCSKEQSGAGRRYKPPAMVSIPQNVVKCKYNAMQCHFIATLRFCWDNCKLYAP